MKFPVVATAVALLTLGVGGCATTPVPLAMEDTVEVSAAVSQVDVANRRLTLQDGIGQAYTLDVDPEVRNLPQVRVGDRVVVRYREAIGAAIRKDGDPSAPTIDLTTDRAAPGARPSAAVKSTATIPVEIIAVDTTKNVVTFYDSERLVRTLPIRRPEAQEWIRGLKPGDQVVVTYAESVAVAVEPATK